MNKKLVVGTLLTLGVFSFASAMEMASGDMMKTTTKANTMMMEGGNKMEDTAMHDTSAMHDSISMSSKKADITKLQMMLVSKGYLAMPKGTQYGYYGSLTKMAYKKYKGGMMMKTGDAMKSNNAMMMNASDSMMMNH